MEEKKRTSFSIMWTPLAWTKWAILLIHFNICHAHVIFYKSVCVSVHEFSNILFRENHKANVPNIAKMFRFQYKNNLSRFPSKVIDINKARKNFDWKKSKMTQYIRKKVIKLWINLTLWIRKRHSLLNPPEKFNFSHEKTCLIYKT